MQGEAKYGRKAVFSTTPPSKTLHSDAK